MRRSRIDVEQLSSEDVPEVVIFRGLNMGLYQKLSPKQKEILTYALEGHSVGGIAKLMGISKGATQEHMRRIKLKYQGKGVGKE